MGQNYEKKNHEDKCLKDVVAVGAKLRGETRRILRRLPMDHYNSDRERPDFVFHIPSNKRGVAGTSIGLEHFMIDQCCENQRKHKGVNSLAAKRRAEINGLYHKYADEIKVDGNLPDILIDELMTLVANTMSDSLSSSYPELMESFKTVFFNHLDKVDEYRKNLKSQLIDGEHIEIGFLIEIHADMSKYHRANTKGAQQCVPGDIIIFDDMLNAINGAKGKVDFIILAVYGNIDIEPRNVLAFKCGNPEKSITKQHVPIITYAGIEADLDAFVKPHSKVSVTYSRNEENDAVNAVFTVNKPVLEEKALIELLFRSIMRAWYALRDGKSYVANKAIVEFMDLFGDLITGWRRLTDDENEWRVRPIMSRPPFYPNIWR